MREASRSFKKKSLQRKKPRMSQRFKMRRARRNLPNLRKLTSKKKRELRLRKKSSRKSGSIRSRATPTMKINPSFLGMMNAIFLSLTKKLSRNVKSNFSSNSHQFLLKRSLR